MRGPPDPEMRKGRLAKGSPQSQEINRTQSFKSDALELQALRLQRLYFLAHDMARTVAALAYGVAR
jgi:hypothetical protein